MLRLNPKHTAGIFARASRAGSSWSAAVEEGGYPFIPGRPFVISVTVAADGFGVKVDVDEASALWQSAATFEATIADVRSIRIPSAVTGSWTNVAESGKSWSGKWWVGSGSPTVLEGARLGWRWDNADDTKNDARLGLSTMKDGVLHERVSINKNGNVGLTVTSEVNRLDVSGGVAGGSGIP